MNIHCKFCWANHEPGSSKTFCPCKCHQNGREKGLTKGNGEDVIKVLKGALEDNVFAPQPPARDWGTLTPFGELVKIMSDHIVAEGKNITDWSYEIGHFASMFSQLLKEKEVEAGRNGYVRGLSARNPNIKEIVAQARQDAFAEIEKFVEYALIQNVEEVKQVLSFIKENKTKND